jgi:c-di-GMP-binding flagellar brake protein YcgR
MAGLIKYFYLIDQKLNTILDVLACGKENSLFLKAPAKINISGSGVKFITEEKVQEGDYLEIRIALPGWPLSVIPALGQVVHAAPSPEPGKHEIAIHFTAISEHAREDLTRYIIRMERALLRSQSECGLRPVEKENKKQAKE